MWMRIILDVFCDDCGKSPGEKPNLQRTLQFTYNDKNALVETLDGVGLERAIRQYTGEDPLIYAAKKLQILQRVGYEDGEAEVNFDLIVPNNQISDVYEYLVDFALGLIPSLQVRNFTSRDARFGVINHEQSQVIEGTGEVRIDRKPVEECDIRLRTQDGNEEYRIKTSAYLPYGFSHLVDKTYIKVRCAAPGLDFIFWTQQPRFAVRLHFPPSDESQKLSQLFPAARYVLFHHKALSQGGEVIFDLSTEGQRIAKDKFTISIPIDAYTLQVAETILRAWTICKHFDVHDEVKTNIAELIRQKERLQIVALALGPLPEVRLTSWVDPVIEDTSKEVCFPYVARVVIDQYQVVLALAMLGVPRSSGRVNEYGTEYEVKIHRIRIHHKYLNGCDESLEFSGQRLI
jgi:hypothetical protein